MIEIHDLFKRFGTLEALKYVSFSVDKGEAVGLLGENGAGKSTIMRILSCFLPPTSGTARVAGHDVIASSMAVRRSIGYMPESVPLYPLMRVEEYLRFRARLKGVSARDAREAVDRAMSLTSVTDRRRSLIGTLSKGLRQRVGLSDALVHRPQLLILDEPTSGLDPNQRSDLRTLLRDLVETHTVLISTHILPEVEASCSRCVIVSRGTIVAQKTMDEMRRLGESRSHTVVARIVGTTQALLEGLDDVTLENVEDVEGATRFEVQSTGGRAAIGALVAAIVGGGGEVFEVSPRRSLEDAFARLVEASDPS